MPRIPISQCFVVLRSAPPSARPRSTTTGRSGSRSQCLRIPASHESTTRDWVEGEAGAGRMGETAGPVGVLDALAAADTAWTPEWTPQRRPGGVLSACGVPRLGGWPPAPRSGRGRCRVSKSPEGVARPRQRREEVRRVVAPSVRSARIAIRPSVTGPSSAPPRGSMTSIRPSPWPQRQSAASTDDG